MNPIHAKPGHYPIHPKRVTTTQPSVIQFKTVPTLEETFVENYLIARILDAIMLGGYGVVIKQEQGMLSDRRGKAGQSPFRLT